MDEDGIKELVNNSQSNQGISCKSAFRIAEEAGVSKRKVGEILNEMEVKIHSCQLGCFD